MSNPIAKIWLIATREYAAYVKTVGFWLSLLTVPMIIIMSSIVPALLIKADPHETVAVIDLTGEQLTPAIEAVIAKAGQKPEIPEALARAAKTNPALKMITTKMSEGGLSVAAWPQPVPAGATLEATEAQVKAGLREANMPLSSVLLAYQQDGHIAYRVWTKPGFKSHVADDIRGGLYELSFFREAKVLGLSPDQATALNETKAEIDSHDIDYVPTPTVAPKPTKKGVEGRAILGALVGYLTWIAVFSSSMLLLSSVIEEKANRVLEVLLASTSTESLLTGKVIGVAMVLVTVIGLWGVVGGLGVSYGVSLLPPHVSASIMTAVSGLFTPMSLILMVLYLVGGYLMFGMFFTVVGAFCETPKDAQSIIGPMMIVLMIPMIALQSSFVSPDLPMIKFLSYVPVFSPFLMPVRLGTAQPWEIAVTLGFMAAVTWFMMGLGRRAFKQGALSTGKVSFKSFFAALRVKD